VAAEPDLVRHRAAALQARAGRVPPQSSAAAPASARRRRPRVVVDANPAVVVAGVAVGARAGGGHQAMQARQ
jgi:hypothetical protein